MTDNIPENEIQPKLEYEYHRDFYTHQLYRRPIDWTGAWPEPPWEPIPG